MGCKMQFVNPFTIKSSTNSNTSEINILSRYDYMHIHLNEIYLHHCLHRRVTLYGDFQLHEQCKRNNLTAKYSLQCKARPKPRNWAFYMFSNRI